MTDTPPAKIEPWIRRLALDTVDYIIRHLSVDRYDLTDHVALRLHFSIAAHAPKQEPLSKSVHKRLIAQGAIDPSVPIIRLLELGQLPANVNALIEEYGKGFMFFSEVSNPNCWNNPAADGQEPSVPVSKLKEFERELQWGSSIKKLRRLFTDIIHQAEQVKP